MHELVVLLLSNRYKLNTLNRQYNIPNMDKRNVKDECNDKETRPLLCTVFKYRSKHTNFLVKPKQFQKSYNSKKSRNC